MEYVKMGLTISFIILFSLLLWLIIGLRGNWILKSGIILIALFFSVSTISSIENFYGWPTVQSMPEEYRVYWALAQEPDEARGVEGAIYFWAEGQDGESWPESKMRLLTFENNRMNGVRAYKIPYSTDMHELVITIVEKIIAGEVVVASSLDNDIPEEFMFSEENGSSQQGTDDIMFYSLPPAGAMRKGN